MSSPVPKHLRTDDEIKRIRPKLRDHVVDLIVDPSNLFATLDGSPRHPAKYAPGLPTELVNLAGTDSLGDPMAGTGRLFEETLIHRGAANELDPAMFERLQQLAPWVNMTVSNVAAHKIRWRREVCIFSPPYYPRTDRCRPNAHDDRKRGPVVGFRDSYGFSHPDFIGNPAGADGIKEYRKGMSRIYRHLTKVCRRMLVVTKNWTRLGVELRLDLDTILMAESVGWKCTARHGWQPPASLWARFNQSRGTGCQIEDVLVFDRKGP